MKEALRELKGKLANFGQQELSLHKNFKRFLKNRSIVLPAGGEGKRFKNIMGNLNINKSVYVLPNKETMIERTIKMYRDLGFSDFIILVCHQAESVISLLGNGTKYGINIVYSHDPETLVGRGGAIKNALVNGRLKEGNYLIVHNPDDQIVGESKDILISVINKHLYNEERGAVASVVVVEGAPYAYSGMKIENDLVVDTQVYPFIPIPTHIGITIFSPGVHKYFYTLFDPDKKCDFEGRLFPVLKTEKKLYACQIPTGSWIPVNDEKGFKKLVEYLSV